MVTPIFNTLMRIDKSLVEAARDAGASSWQVLTNVIIPLANPGMAIGTIFVVTLVMADFSTVQVMSGGQSASVALMMKNRCRCCNIRRRRQCRCSADPRSFMVAGILRIVDIRKSFKMYGDKRSREFYILAIFFAVFVLFLLRSAVGPSLSSLFKGRMAASLFRSTVFHCTGSPTSLRTQAVGDFGRLLPPLRRAGSDG